MKLWVGFMIVLIVSMVMTLQCNFNSIQRVKIATLDPNTTNISFTLPKGERFKLILSSTNELNLNKISGNVYLKHDGVSMSLAEVPDDLIQMNKSWLLSRGLAKSAFIINVKESPFIEDNKYSMTLNIQTNVFDSLWLYYIGHN